MRDAQQQLLSRLGAALDDATAFVLLWTYFKSVGLTDAENGFIRRKLLPEAIDPFPLHNDDDRNYRTVHGRYLLARAPDEEAFDQSAAAWLKGLDFLLTRQIGTFEHRSIAGFKDGPYVVRPTNSWIPSRFERAGRAIAGNRKQSLSLAAYCRHFRVVPAFPMGGLGIECRASSEWANPYIEGRLRESSDPALRFLCWPLGCELQLTTSPPDGKTELSFARVSVAGDATERRSEIERAVAAANREGAAILLFPELSAAADDIAFLSALLADHMLGELPVLTVAGLEHAESDGGYVNEAVVLGPYGEELHRHRKLARFRDEQVIEQTITGERITVLESPIGNLCALICLDLFNDEIEPLVTASHANVLLVPSLSGKTSAHEIAASEYLNSNLATTVVCNRRTGAPHDGSFALFPGKDEDAHTMIQRIDKGAPFLLAELAFQESFK